MGYSSFDAQVALLNEKLAKVEKTISEVDNDLQDSFDTTRFDLVRGFTVVASDESLPAGMTILFRKDATLTVKQDGPASTRYTPLETLEYRARKLGANGVVDVHSERGRLVGTPVLLGRFNPDGLTRAQLVQEIRHGMRFTGNEMQGIINAANERHRRKMEHDKKLFKSGYSSGYDKGYKDAWLIYSN